MCCVRNGPTDFLNLKIGHFCHFIKRRTAWKFFWKAEILEMGESEIFYVKWGADDDGAIVKWLPFWPIVLQVLKWFFHASAHARVLRNLICLPARNEANFWGFTRRSVEGGFYLKKSVSVLQIGDQKSFCLDHIFCGVGFYFYFTVPSLNLSESCKFSNVTSRATSRVTVIRKGS